MAGLDDSGASGGHPVTLMFYEVVGDLLVLDLVTLESMYLDEDQLPPGSPCTVSIQAGPEKELLDELLRRWVLTDEPLHLSFQQRDSGGRLVLESASVMVVLRTEPTLRDNELGGT
jgi:hypothetical protein